MVGNQNGSLSEWATECGWFQKKDKATPDKSKVNRLIKKLEKAKMIKKYGRGYSVTAPGKSAAKRADLD
jgi:hypothetical protein